jgi:hypothetical protein
MLNVSIDLIIAHTRFSFHSNKPRAHHTNGLISTFNTAKKQKNPPITENFKDDY